jgi:PQQ-dependent catabolism-associated CXXCW motif protein
MARKAAPKAAAALLLLLAAAAPPPEPSGLWSGPQHGTTPLTLSGAIVLPSAKAAKSWLETQLPVVIDVSPAPAKPPHMAPGMPWLPSAHQDIPGSIWLPNAGQEVLQPNRAAAYLRKVKVRATPDKPIMVYCHANCWGSWNAAKVLVQAGYHHVAWFPGGIETWSAADYTLQRTRAAAY